MPICTFSNDYDAKNYTMLENRFITDFLHILTKEETEVYIFGLYLCHNVYGEDNNLEGVCKGTNLKNSEVKKAFEGLQNYGLVTIVSTAPLAVRYNLPSKAVKINRKYNPDKYSDFILAIQQLFVDKELTENDLYAFVDFLEESKMEDGALLLIAKYCIDLKGRNVSRNYILTVARNWLNEGCLTIQDVESRLFLVESMNDDIKQILHALKSKRAVDIDDRELYLKWTKMGYTLDAILIACKQIKRGGMNALDELLEKYSQEGVFTKEDVKAYGDRKNQILECTKDVLKTLCLRHNYDYESIADTVIAPWFQKGFTSSGLVMIARYCFMNSTKDLAGFTKEVDNFYRDGYISEQGIKLRLDALARFDNSVQEVLDALGIVRQVTAQDRDFYRTWVVYWGISEDTILEIAKEMRGKAYAMAGLSQRLSELKGSTVPRVNAPQQQKEEGKYSDFEKAEIRRKLLDDPTYAKLIGIKKKIDFDMSEYVFGDKPIPVTLQAERDKIQEQINTRIKELGYNPEDLK